MRCSRPCFLCNRNQYKILATELSQVRLSWPEHKMLYLARVRPSNSTSTSRGHDGFFSFVHFLCYLWKLLFSVWGDYSLPVTGCCYLFFFVSAGQHSQSPTCLGMGNKEIRGMYYRLCAVVCFIIFLLSPYFLLAFPLCSRIVWDYLCRGGLRRAGWPGLICLVNNISIVSSACGGLNAFLIYVNYPKDGDESLWAQMEVIGGGFAIPIIKWLGIAVSLFIQWLAWVSILMSGRLCEPVYAATDLRWVSLLARL